MWPILSIKDTIIGKKIMESNSNNWYTELHSAYNVALHCRIDEWMNYLQIIFVLFMPVTFFYVR